MHVAAYAAAGIRRNGLAHGSTRHTSCGHKEALQYRAAEMHAWPYLLAAQHVHALKPGLEACSAAPLQAHPHPRRDVSLRRAGLAVVKGSPRKVRPSPGCGCWARPHVHVHRCRDGNHWRGCSEAAVAPGGGSSHCGENAGAAGHGRGHGLAGRGTAAAVAAELDWHLHMHGALSRC